MCFGTTLDPVFWGKYIYLGKFPKKTSNLEFQRKFDLFSRFCVVIWKGHNENTRISWGQKKTKHQVVHLKKTFPQHKYIGLIPRTFPEMRCVGSFPKHPLVTSSDTFTLLNPLKYYQSATLRIISAETEQQYKGFPGSWTTSGVKVPFHLKTNGPKWSLGPRHPKYLLRRCFGYAFRVQIPNLRRSLDV